MIKKTLLSFCLLASSLALHAQEQPPPFSSNFKQLNTSTVYINLPDSALWIYKGQSMGWSRLNPGDKSDPINYGAVPNDNIPDDAYIQACLNKTGLARLKNGTYIISNPILLSSYQKIIGESRNGVILKLANNSNKSVIKLANDLVRKVEIRSLSIDGNRANQTGDCNAIDLTNRFFDGSMNYDAYHCLSDLFITYVRGNGLKLYGRGESNISNIAMDFITGYGLYANTADQWISDISVGHASIGVYIESAGNLRFINSKSWGSDAGWVIHADRSTFVNLEAQDVRTTGFTITGSKNTITNILVDAVGYDFSLGTGYPNATSVTITGDYNTVQGTTLDRAEFSLHSGTQQYALYVTGQYNKVSLISTDVKISAVRSKSAMPPTNVVNIIGTLKDGTPIVEDAISNINLESSGSFAYQKSGIAFKSFAPISTNRKVYGFLQNGALGSSGSSFILRHMDYKSQLNSFYDFFNYTLDSTNSSLRIGAPSWLALQINGVDKFTLNPIGSISLNQTPLVSGGVLNTDYSVLTRKNSTGDVEVLPPSVLVPFTISGAPYNTIYPQNGIKTASYTALVSDAAVIFDTRTADMIFTLPTSGVPIGKRFEVYKAWANNNLDVISSGGTINGASSFRIQQVKSSYVLTYTGGSSYLVTAGYSDSMKEITIFSSSTIDFPSTADGSSSFIDVTVADASINDFVILGIPPSVLVPGCIYTASVSSANTVRITLTNRSGSFQDPGAAWFKIKVSR